MITTTFRLSEAEEIWLQVWLAKLKKKYGQYGHISYKFTPVGFGTNIRVRSSVEKKWRDITDYTTW